MDTLTPFPPDVDLFIEQYVGRWYVVVHNWEALWSRNDSFGIVMMYPCKTYVDALKFVDYHTTR
jgi:hypothetical protein